MDEMLLPMSYPVTRVDTGIHPAEPTAFNLGRVALRDEARWMAAGVLARRLPRRWRHVRAVGQKAERSAFILSAEDRDLVIAAAWLHDVGYAPELVSTGLHALDGGRWLRDNGMPMRLAGLVAHHSCAIFEAAERGVLEELTAEFPAECSLATDVLWYADMTTGPDGEDCDVLDRLAEIRSRYGPDHVVTRFWDKAEPVIVATVRRVEVRLRVQPM